MKSKNNKILAAVVCGTIAASIGVSVLRNIDEKEDKKITLNKEIKNTTLEENSNSFEEINSDDSNGKEELIDKNEVDVEADNTSIISNDNNREEDNNPNPNSSTNNNGNNTGEVNSPASNSQGNNANNSNSNINTDDIQTPSQDTNLDIADKGESSNEEIPSGNDGDVNNENESNESAKYTDGSYDGVARGKEKGLEVRVEILNGQIASVIVTSHNEMPAFADSAIETIPSRIVSAQSTNVDTVSGATYTSKGIIKAVNNALSKAN